MSTVHRLQGQTSVPRNLTSSQCCCSTFNFKRQTRKRSAPFNRSPPVVSANLFESIRDFFDFEKWAPRSSRAWRLGESPFKSSDEPITEESLDILNDRLQELAAERTSSLVNNESIGQQQDVNDPSSSTPMLNYKSFEESSDDELADSLNSRIFSMTSTQSTGSTDDANLRDGQYQTNTENFNDEEEEQICLTGELLKELLMQKYGKSFDMSFVRRDLPGKTFVSLNIFYAHLGQRSFPMTEKEYSDKLDGIAALLSMWGQSDKVYQELSSPLAPKRGLPSVPVVGIALPIQLDLSDEMINEFFPR